MNQGSCQVWIPATVTRSYSMRTLLASLRSVCAQADTETRNCLVQVSTVKKRYEVGLEKLATTESSVADMQGELIALQPQLEESTKETEAAMVVRASAQPAALISLWCVEPAVQSWDGYAGFAVLMLL